MTRSELEAGAFGWVDTPNVRVYLTLTNQWVVDAAESSAAKVRRELDLIRVEDANLPPGAEYYRLEAAAKALGGELKMSPSYFVSGDPQLTS